MIRDNIIKYFPDRDCITLVRPVETEEELKSLNKMNFQSLKTDFKSEFLILKDKIFKDSKPKCYKGMRLNGPNLVNLLTEFIDAINQGAVPNINNVYFKLTLVGILLLPKT